MLLGVGSEMIKLELKLLMNSTSNEISRPAPNDSNRLSLSESSSAIYLPP